MQVLSYQIADNIDIRQFKSAFKAELHYSDADELFYIMASLIRVKEPEIKAWLAMIAAMVARAMPK